MFLSYVDDGERLAVEYLPHGLQRGRRAETDGYLMFH